MTNSDISKNKHQLLREILDDLVEHNPTVFTAIVVSDDGLKVASGIPHTSDDDVALTASNLMDAAADFANRLEQGRLNRIILEGEQRITVVMKASHRTILAVLLPYEEKLGLITMAMRRASERIATIFE